MNEADTCVNYSKKIAHESNREKILSQIQCDLSQHTAYGSWWQC